ncbi:hypothetical protein B0O99DRAFT_672654 [Bisporella sp. PMI_857]|nr:hypothetical protein B0O99DRAFT_672654 [Bisporella sp. PMI_857]
MAASVTRATFLRSSRVWPTWLPDAIAETERQAFQSQLVRQSHQSSFHFSACLQTIFSIQDSILGVQNPLHLQQARAFSQQSITRRRALSLLSGPAPAGSSQARYEHTSTRPMRASSAPPSIQKAKAEKYYPSKTTRHAELEDEADRMDGYAPSRSEQGGRVEAALCPERVEHPDCELKRCPEGEGGEDCEEGPGICYLLEMVVGKMEDGDLPNGLVP